MRSDTSSGKDSRAGGVAGILLAAGASRRFGRPKPLLDWKGIPFVRVLAEKALRAGLSPVVVVTGAYAEDVEAALQGIPVRLARNDAWDAGQSTSVRMGILSLREAAPRAALFLLADQPQIPVALLRKFLREYERSGAAVLASRVGTRWGNPVLFDSSLFPKLLALRGDAGGRVLFEAFPPHPVFWEDESILLDADTPEEYEKMKDLW